MVTVSSIKCYHHDSVRQRARPCARPLPRRSETRRPACTTACTKSSPSLRFNQGRVFFAHKCNLYHWNRVTGRTEPLNTMRQSGPTLPPGQWCNCSVQTRSNLLFFKFRSVSLPAGSAVPFTSCPYLWFPSQSFPPVRPCSSVTPLTELPPSSGGKRM